jgi:Holliday junction resolvasome RuvABC endonuclease subunit
MDPGVSNPGLAVVERSPRGWNLLHLPVLKCLDDLFDELSEVRKRWDINCVSYESVAWSTQGHLKNAKTKVHQNAKSQLILLSVGAVQFFAREQRVPCIEVEGKRWRKAITGNGRASKEDARDMIKRQILAGWPKREVGLNRSDAACIAVAGPRTVGVDLMRNV